MALTFKNGSKNFENGEGKDGSLPFFVWRNSCVQETMLCSKNIRLETNIDLKNRMQKNYVYNSVKFATKLTMKGA